MTDCERSFLNAKIADMKRNMRTAGQSNEDDAWSNYVDVTPKFLATVVSVDPGYNLSHHAEHRRFRVCIIEHDEDPVPYVHVFYERSTDDSAGINVSYICLGSSEYNRHRHNRMKTLNSRELRDLTKFFETESKTYSKYSNGKLYLMTNWDIAVSLWLQRKPESKKYFIRGNDGRFIMPNYMKLKRR